MAQQTKTGTVSHRVWKRPCLQKRHCDINNQPRNISNAMTITSVNPLCLRKDDRGIKTGSHPNEKDSKVSQRVQKFSCETKAESSVPTSSCENPNLILPQTPDSNSSNPMSVEHLYQQNVVTSAKTESRKFSQTSKMPSNLEHVLVPSYQPLTKSSNYESRPSHQDLPVSTPEQTFTSHWGNVADCLHGTRVSKNQDHKTNYQGQHGSKPDQTFTSHWGKVADCLNGANLAKGGYNHPSPAPRNAGIGRECSSFKILSVSLIARQAQITQNLGHKKDTTAAPAVVSDKLSSFIKSEYCTTASEAGQNLKAATAYRYQSKRLTSRGKVELTFKTGEENTKCIAIKEVVFGETVPQSMGKEANRANDKVNQRRDLVQGSSKNVTSLPASSVNAGGQWINPVDTNHMYADGDETVTEENSVKFSYNHTKTDHLSESIDIEHTSQQCSSTKVPDKSESKLSIKTTHLLSSPVENGNVLSIVPETLQEPESIADNQVPTGNDMNAGTFPTRPPDAKQPCVDLSEPERHPTNCENTNSPSVHQFDINRKSENGFDTNSISENYLETTSIARNDLNPKTNEEKHLVTRRVSENHLRTNSISENVLDANSIQETSSDATSNPENDLETKSIPEANLETNSFSDICLETRSIDANTLDMNRTEESCGMHRSPETNLETQTISENFSDKDSLVPEDDLENVVRRRDTTEEETGGDFAEALNLSNHCFHKHVDQTEGDMMMEQISQEKQTYVDKNFPVDRETGKSSSELTSHITTATDMDVCFSRDSKVEDESNLLKENKNKVSENVIGDLPKKFKRERLYLGHKTHKGSVKKYGNTSYKTKTRITSGSNYNPKQVDKMTADAKLREDLYKDTGGPIGGRVRSAQAHVMRSVVRIHHVMNTRRSKSVLGIASIKELARDEQPSEGDENEDRLTEKQTVWFMALWEQCVNNKTLDRVLPIMKKMPRLHRKQLTETAGKVPLLLDATKLGSVQMVDFLIEECGADVEKTGLVHDTSFPFCDNTFSVSSLWYAAVAGHVEVVKTLLQHRANIHFKTSRGSTPLRSACFASQVEAARLLLEAGADVNAANYMGSTCLMNSVLCPELVRLLLAYGARPNDVDLGGNTALHYAAGEGVLQSVQHIVQFGGDCLHRNRNGICPLHRCAVEGWKDIVDYIVKSTPALKHVEVIEAYELLGCGYVDKFDSYDLALHQWEFGLKLRDKSCPKLKVRKERIAAFGNSLECVNLRELHAIASDPDQIRMHSLLVLERIYGENNKEFINVLLSRASMYFDTLKMFRQGMELFKFAFRLQATVHHPLSMIQMYTAQQITWLLLDSVGDSSRRPENWEQRASTDDCLQVLASLVSILDKAKPAMRDFLHSSPHPDSCVCPACDTGGILYPYNVKCACRRHTEKGRETYFLLIVYALHLVRLVTTHMQLSPGQLHRFRSTVYRLVKSDHRLQTGESLLHLCFPLCDPWDTGSLCVPTMPLLKTLIVCGADSDALDDFGESPLMYLFFSRDGWSPMEILRSHPDKRRWVQLLVDHKAHVDRVSLLGNDLLKALREEQGQLDDEMICIHSHVNLQCLAARAIRRHGVPYDDQEMLPRELIRFVSFH